MSLSRLLSRLFRNGGAEPVPAAQFPAPSSSQRWSVASPQIYQAQLSYEPAAPPNFTTRSVPKYRGREICDWNDTVASLKREERLEEALTIATGCMKAMQDSALRNPDNVMEHYVIEVCKIQHKMRFYDAEISTIEAWLDLNIPPSRADHRLNLRKRLAKARECSAREKGLDPSPYKKEWHALVEQEKTAKRDEQERASGKQDTNRGTMRTNQRKPSLIPSVDELMLPEFVAVDFETANSLDGASACQIALVKFSMGNPMERLATLIKPPRGLDEFQFTYIHGITRNSVRNAPMWPDVAPYVASFVGGRPVYAHNASFDSRVWNSLDSFFGTATLPQQFFCSYRLSQRVIPGLPDYKLPTVVSACAPQFHLNHHEASSDAEACGRIVAAVQCSPALRERLNHR
ncbi:MAG: hypothetical protein E7Z97_12245 [Propionibacteriaceae bacterium]|nr:hypothetical protein [Propionibacteriaceae bacterium]